MGFSKLSLRLNERNIHNQSSRMIGGLLLLALAVSLLSATLWAQGTPEGRLAGVVHDPTGAVVPNAKITVTNTGTGVKYTAKTGSEGSFYVPTVPSGEYSVQVEATGFSQTVYNHVKIDAAK
jgi:hypothetical protein